MATAGSDTCLLHMAGSRGVGGLGGPDPLGALQFTICVLVKLLRNVKNRIVNDLVL